LFFACLLLASFGFGDYTVTSLFCCPVVFLPSSSPSPGGILGSWLPPLPHSFPWTDLLPPADDPRDTTVQLAAVLTPRPSSEPVELDKTMATKLASPAGGLDLDLVSFVFGLSSLFSYISGVQHNPLLRVCRAMDPGRVPTSRAGNEQSQVVFRSWVGGGGGGGCWVTAGETDCDGSSFSSLCIASGILYYVFLLSLYHGREERRGSRGRRHWHAGRRRERARERRKSTGSGSCSPGLAQPG